MEQINLTKINLEKKYTYLPLVRTKDKKKGNPFDMLRSLDNRSLLEQIGIADYKIDKKVNELREVKIEAMKNLIISGRKIPEKWIMKEDYKQILNEVMSDPSVLMMSILFKDIYKKTSTNVGYDINPNEILKKNRSTNKLYFSLKDKEIFSSDRNNYQRRLDYENKLKQEKYKKKYLTEEIKNEKVLKNFITKNVSESKLSTSIKKNDSKYSKSGLILTDLNSEGNKYNYDTKGNYIGNERYKNLPEIEF